MKIKVLVAAHKPYNIANDSVYQPIMVGSALSAEIPAGYTRDDSGKNISTLNPFYNELTALYWAKYNLTDYDAVGLVHYRRYLAEKPGHDLHDVLTAEQIELGLAKADVLLPKRRNYVIETQRSHYMNAHLNEPYRVMREVIEEFYPAYLQGFDQMSGDTRAHLFNISIMKQTQFQDYTDFMFGVLKKVQERIDYENYEGQDRRVFGFLAERLMDTWVNTNQPIIKEFPMVTTERTNWFDKGFQFLKRKYWKHGKKKVHF